MNEKLGLFWGSDTGMTEVIVGDLIEILSESFDLEIIDMYNVSVDDFNKYNKYIFVLPTWYDGELQSDWEEFFGTFCTLNFSNKKAAIVGLGDQIGYGSYYVDGIGIIGRQVLNAGGNLVGKWPTESYDFEESKAELESGWFCGLALDEDNQPELTPSRLEKWCHQISKEFSN